MCSTTPCRHNFRNSSGLVFSKFLFFDGCYKTIVKECQPIRNMCGTMDSMTGEAKGIKQQWLYFSFQTDELKASVCCFCFYINTYI